MLSSVVPIGIGAAVVVMGPAVVAVRPVAVIVIQAAIAGAKGKAAMAPMITVVSAAHRKGRTASHMRCPRRKIIRDAAAHRRKITRVSAANRTVRHSSDGAATAKTAEMATSTEMAAAQAAHVDS